jgi:hypothetical protein
MPVSLDDDFEEELDRVACPFCCRSFDPYARKDPGADASQSASLDELIESEDEDEDDDEDEQEQSSR